MDKVAVAIPCWRRPEYLTKCLESLRGQADLLLYPDQDDDEHNERVIEIGQRHGAIVQPPAQTRLYCCGNKHRALKETFEAGYDYVVHIDSDMMFSPHYVRLMLAAHKWAGGNHIIGSSVTFRGNQWLKHHLSGAVYHSFATGTNMLFSAENWARMLPSMQYYHDHWIVGHKNGVLNDTEIRHWFAQQMLPMPKYREYMWDRVICESGGTGHDAAMQLAAAVGGVRVALTVVNRAVLIGEYGENTTPETFAAVRGVCLDVIDSDKDRVLFHWYD